MRILAPLLLCLLLTACQLDGTVLRMYPATANPQNSPTAAFFDTGVGERVENAPQSSPEPSSVPVDANATVAASLAALKAAQDTTAALQAQLADEKARAVTVQLEIEQAKAQAAKYNAAQTGSELAIVEAEIERLRLVNAGVELEIERLELEVKDAQAQAAIADATTRQFVAFLVAALCIVAALVSVSRWRNPRPPAPVEAEQDEQDEFPELRKLDRPIIQTSETTFDTDTNPPGNIDKFRAYAEYALNGWALGINSVVSKAKIYGSHPEYTVVLNWMRKKKYTSEQNGQIGLSDLGKRDLELWSYNFNPPT